MKALTATFAGLLSAGILLPVAQAAEVKVVWQDPDSYRDIEPTSQSKSSFRRNVFTNLEEYFKELGETLPADATWTITVTNLDLAGQVWPASFANVGFGMNGLGNSMNDVRVVKSIDIPRMSFSYSLNDAEGAVIKSADVSIKDMGFMDRSIYRDRWDNYRYEKQMLKDWFAEEMAEVQLSRQ